MFERGLHRLAYYVATSSGLSNGSIKVGLWMFGIAVGTGEKTLTLTIRDIQKGVKITTLNSIKHFGGTGSRPETIRTALAELQTAGFITISPGNPVGGGYTAQVITLKD